MKDGQDRNKLVIRLFAITWVILFALAGAVIWFLLGGGGSRSVINNYVGKSAYQIAVEHGFKGDEAMWLESLKPTFEQPKDGRDGKDSVSTHTVETNTVQKEIIKEVPVKGDKGDKGDAPQMAFDTSTNKWYARYGTDDDWQLVPTINVSGIKQLLSPNHGDDE